MVGHNINCIMTVAWLTVRGASPLSVRCDGLGDTKNLRYALILKVLKWEGEMYTLHEMNMVCVGVRPWYLVPLHKNSKCVIKISISSLISPNSENMKG